MQSPDGGADARLVTRFDQEAVDAIAHHLGNAADPACDYDRAGLERFLDADRIVVGPQGREDQAVGVLDQRAAELAGEEAVEADSVVGLGQRLTGVERWPRTRDVEAQG